MPGGFVEEDGGCRSGIQGLDGRRHRDADAGVGAALDLFGEASAFVAYEESDGLAPVDLPRSEQGLVILCGFGFAGAGG